MAAKGRVTSRSRSRSTASSSAPPRSGSRLRQRRRCGSTRTPSSSRISACSVAASISGCSTGRPCSWPSKWPIRAWPTIWAGSGFILPMACPGSGSSTRRRSSPVCTGAGAIRVFRDDRSDVPAVSHARARPGARRAARGFGPRTSRDALSRAGMRQHQHTSTSALTARACTRSPATSPPSSPRRASPRGSPPSSAATPPPRSSSRRTPTPTCSATSSPSSDSCPRAIRSSSTAPGARRHAGARQGSAHPDLPRYSMSAGRLALGTWQGVYLFEHRTAPTRAVCSFTSWARERPGSLSAAACPPGRIDLPRLWRAPALTGRQEWHASQRIGDRGRMNTRMAALGCGLAFALAGCAGSGSELTTAGVLGEEKPRQPRHAEHGHGPRDPGGLGRGARRQVRLQLRSGQAEVGLPGRRGASWPWRRRTRQDREGLALPTAASPRVCRATAPAAPIANPPRSSPTSPATSPAISPPAAQKADDSIWARLFDAAA